MIKDSPRSLSSQHTPKNTPSPESYHKTSWDRSQKVKKKTKATVMVSGSRYCNCGTPSRTDHQMAGNVRVQGNTPPIPPCTHQRRPAVPGGPRSLRTLRKPSGNLRKSCNRSGIHLHRQGNRTMHHPRREREWSSCCHKRRMVGKNQFQCRSPPGLANNLPTASNTTCGGKWWVGRKR